MEFVLDGSEKLFSNFFICIIVGDTLRINISDFLVESPLARTNITDTRQLFFKIVLAENVVGVFSRSSSMAKPLMMYSLSTCVAQMRKCVACLEFTR